MHINIAKVLIALRKKKGTTKPALPPPCVIPIPLAPNPTNQTKTVAAPKAGLFVGFFLAIKNK